MNNAQLKTALIQREIDIALARPSLDDDDFRTETFHSEPLILALPDNSALAAMEVVPFNALQDETFVIYPRRPRPSFADHILEVCRSAGFAPADVIEAQDYQTAISLVSVGVGVSIVPASVAEASRPGVFFRKYDGPNPGTALSIHARIDNRSPHVMNFFDLVRKNARKSALRS